MNDKVSEEKYWQDKIRHATDLCRAGEYTNAFKVYEEIGENISGYGLRLMGWMYFLGIGIEQDRDRGILVMTQAVELGDPRAQFGLGRFFEVLDDVDKAKEFYKASQHDCLPSSYRLTRLYLYKTSSDEVRDRALNLLKKNIIAGHMPSKRDYSFLLMKGRKGFYGRVRGVCLFCIVLCQYIFYALYNPMSEKLIFSYPNEFRLALGRKRWGRTPLISRLVR